MFLTKRFYIFVLVVILLLGGGYLFGSMFIIGQLGLVALLLALAFDGYLLYQRYPGLPSMRRAFL